MISSESGSCSSESEYVSGRPQDQVVGFSEEITGTKSKRVEVSWFLFPLRIVSVAQILSMQRNGIKAAVVCFGGDITRTEVTDTKVICSRS
jgi:hypothetical protein